MANIYLGVKENISTSKCREPFNGLFSKLGVGEAFSLGSIHVCEMFPMVVHLDIWVVREETYQKGNPVCVCMPKSCASPQFILVSAPTQTQRLKACDISHHFLK